LTLFTSANNPFTVHLIALGPFLVPPQRLHADAPGPRVRLDPRRIAAGDALLDPLVGSHHFVTVLVDVVERSLDLLQGERQDGYDFLARTSCFEVVQDIGGKMVTLYVTSYL